MTVEIHDNSSEAMLSLLPAMGSLFYASAHLENVLTATIKVTLIKSFGTPDDQLKRAYALTTAAVGGQRYSAARDIISRFITALEMSADQKTYYKAVFGQAGEIMKFRDRLAHHYTHQASQDYNGLWINRNEISIKLPGSEEHWLFPVKAIYMATSDLAMLRDAFDGFHDYHVVSQNRRLPYNLDPILWKFSPSMIVRDRKRIGGILSGQQVFPSAWAS